MKKKLLPLLLCLPLASFAKFTTLYPFEIISDKQMNVPESVKKDIDAKIEQEKNLGYIESDEDYPRDLLSNRTTAKAEIEQFKNNTNPYDSHLKGSLSDIKLAFPFKGISSVKKEDILGYSVAGGYIKDKDKPNGWTGVGVLFNNGPKEVCNYVFFNLSISHGAAQLSKENTTYSVNNKPSSFYIKGSYNTGFIYLIEWFDKIGMNRLECADMIFDKGIMKNTIALANKIDESLNGRVNNYDV